MHHPQPGDDEPDFTSSEWLPPIMAVDNEMAIVRKAKAGPLVDLLRSDAPLTKVGRLLVADLLDRYCLSMKQGGQKKPIYRTPEAEALVRAAVRFLRAHPLFRSDRDSALDEVSRQFDIPLKTLDNADLGKRASTRRLRKRALGL